MDSTDLSAIPLHIDCFDAVSSTSDDSPSSAGAASSAISLGGKKFQLRVLDRLKNEKTTNLSVDSASFAEKIETLSSTAEKVVHIIERYAKRIEVQKMKAIGVRNLVEGEIENRRTSKLALQSQLTEKMAEVERVTALYDSLVKMEAEQKATIEKLSNNSAE